MSCGKCMTRIASFSKSRAHFSRRGAWHIPNPVMWLDLLPRHRISATSQKSRPFVHAQHMEPFHRNTGPVTPPKLLCHQPAAWLQEGQPKKMSSGCRMSGWVLFKVQSVLKSRFGYEKKVHGRRPAREERLVHKCFHYFLPFNCIGVGCKIILT